MLGKAHVNVLRLVVGVVCGSEVDAGGVARSSCARVGGRADVEMVCWCVVAQWVLGEGGTVVQWAWGCWPRAWGLSWVLGGSGAEKLGRLRRRECGSLAVVVAAALGGGFVGDEGLCGGDGMG